MKLLCYAMIYVQVFFSITITIKNSIILYSITLYFQLLFCYFASLFPVFIISIDFDICFFIIYSEFENKEQQKKEEEKRREEKQTKE